MSGADALLTLPLVTISTFSSFSGQVCDAQINAAFRIGDSKKLLNDFKKGQFFKNSHTSPEPLVFFE